MSSSGLKSASTGKQKDGPRLPWWVELLFVQIGLPDKWLPKILKGRNNSKKVLEENKKKLLYLVIIFLGLIYLHPSSTFYKQQNTCFKQTMRKLKSEGRNNTVSNDVIEMEATNYCNGGYLDQY